MSASCNTEIAAGPVSKCSKQTKQTYTCHICGTKLSRAAHLHRHQLQHSSPKELFQCHICSKEFNRKDVYQRHLRVVHNPNQAAQKKRLKKSCQLCIRYKLKCSRQLPCTACIRKGSTCLYDPFVLDSAAQSKSCTSSHFTLDNSNEPTETIITNQQSACNGNTDSHLEGECSNPYHLSFNDRSNADGGSVPHMVPQEDIHHSILQLSQGFFEPTTTDENYTWLDDISLDLEAFDSSLFRASRMDWLGCETDVSDQSTLPLFAESRQSACNEDFPGREDRMAHVISSRQPFDPSLGNHQPAIDSDQPGNNEREFWPAVLDCGGNESWPFDYTSNQGFRKIKLPPLKEVLEQTMGNTPNIKAGTVKDLIRVLSTPYIPSLSDSLEIGVLPTITFLGDLVKTYFAEFHPSFSIIHIPTWQIEKCPTALLAAMACIGATYSTADGSQEVASILAEISQRSLFWMGQCDSRSYRNPLYIAASCLHQIYAIGSGNRRLYELADASRGLLVTGLRELGVLSSDTDQSEADSLDYQRLRKMSPLALERAWNCWRDTELKRRIAWSVFEFDCSLSTLTSKRGAFSISELPTKVPCSENLWEAPSANAWASLAGLCTSPPTGILFYPLLRETIAQKSIPSTVHPWGKRICALVICRLLWDLREIEDISSSKLLGISSSVDIHNATREGLLSSLSAVSSSLSRPNCLNDVVNLNVTYLTTHFTYLSSGGEMMDLVTFIFRNNHEWKNGHTASRLNKELSRARSHLRLRFGRDPVATRRSVRHAALVITISREYTSFTPCETMRVFFSFAVLLAFSKFFPFEKISEASKLNRPIKLDELPIEHLEPKRDSAQLERWIEHGGPASLGSVDDICDVHNFQALKEDSLQAMDHLRVWGLAKKFHRVLKNFGDD